MKEQYYEAIFRRKSFHLFQNVGSDSLGSQELEEIRQAYAAFEPLIPEIRTALRIVPAEKVNFKRDAEYCLMLYSEKKDNYLMNAGYLGEQLDLYLVAHHIGSLWFGIGKPDEPEYQGMDFVIMIAIRKVNDDSKFRREMFKAKRKPLEETWVGEDPGVGEISRFAPSACNTQPWYVKNENGCLSVYRHRKPGRRGILPATAISYFNRIDIGIYLCFLEICMEHRQLPFQRTLFVDAGLDQELTLVAKYTLS